MAPYKTLPAELAIATSESEKVRDNPAYKSAMEHQRRLAEDPSYRAKFEHTSRLQNDSTRQALLDFQENQRLYRQITDASLPLNRLDERTRRDVLNLRNDLVHNNANLWFKSELLNPDFDWARLVKFLKRADDLVAISPEADGELQNKDLEAKKQFTALQIIEEFYENRTAAEEELDGDERLVIFVKLGKKELRVKDLAVEENTNKIVAFFGDGNDSAIIYCSPFRVEYRFYKEKFDS